MKEEESIESFMQGLNAALELLMKKAEEKGRDKMQPLPKGSAGILSSITARISPWRKLRRYSS